MNMYPPEPPCDEGECQPNKHGHCKWCGNPVEQYEEDGDDINDRRRDREEEEREIEREQR